MIDKNYFGTSDEVCKALSKESDTILVSFSLGKDAIGAWLQCRRFFKRIVPFYLYTVPDLEFVQDSIDYYEQILGQRIMQIPHPALYRFLNLGVFQPPERRQIIKKLDLPNPSFEDIEQMIREDLGLAENVMVATGVRAQDSLVRRLAFRQNGAVTKRTRKAAVTWDWTNSYLLDQINAAGIKLSHDYIAFGRSFDGIGYQYLEPISRLWPRDYERILEWFPLAGLEIARRQYASAR